MKHKQKQYHTNNHNQRVSPPTYLARFPGLIDIVSDGKALAYAVTTDDGIMCTPSTHHDGKRAVPPPPDQLPFLLPRWEQVASAFDDDTPQSLFNDLISYHKRFSRLPSEAYYVLLAAWDFSTYILEYINYSGYIYLYAVPERGKTKTGQSMLYVAYRGIHQEDLREANLFRASHDLAATLFLDITNLSYKAYKENSSDIILQRFEKGARVRRVIHPESGPFRDSRYFDIFGATIIATNEPINEVMESRSFPVDMPYAMVNFPKPKPEDGLPLKERLVAWRGHFMLDNPTLPPAPQFPPGRLNDIAVPLWQIIKLVSPGHCQLFEDFVIDCAERRRGSRSTTIEGEVIRALISLSDEVEDGKLEVDKITDRVNDSRRDLHKESSRYIGKVLRRLGVEMCRRHASKRTYYYDHPIINKLANEYGLADDFVANYIQEYPSKPTVPTSHLSSTSPTSQTDVLPASISPSDGVTGKTSHSLIYPTDNVPTQLQKDTGDFGDMKKGGTGVYKHIPLASETIGQLKLLLSAHQLIKWSKV